MSALDCSGVADLFAKLPKVVAAWAFGSAETGRMTASSDVDIGVLFDAAPSLDELAALREQLQVTLQFDDVDLVAVDERSSPILRFEVVSGRSIYCRDIDRKAEFVSLTAREYEYEMAFLRQGMRWAEEVASATEEPTGERTG